MSRELEEFREFREKMNERIRESGHRGIKRFFALDTRPYEVTQQGPLIDRSSRARRPDALRD